jgi:hypothetical protein
MTKNNGKETGCGCSAAAKQETIETNQIQKRQLEIEFLYLDLNVCQPCQASEANLDSALAEVAQVLQATGVEVNLKKIQVASYEQALELGFISSPTIRVNGRDLALEVRESHCSSCSELSGKKTDCRVWEYQGQEYKAAPKAMIIEAILKEVYGGEKNEPVAADANKLGQSLDNLKSFFGGETLAAASSCGSAACAG